MKYINTFIGNSRPTYLVVQNSQEYYQINIITFNLEYIKDLPISWSLDYDKANNIPHWIIE